MRATKRVIAEQIIPTSTTPPSDAGFYSIDRNTIGVVGDIVAVHPVTQRKVNVVSGAILTDQTVSASRDATIRDSGMFLICDSSSAIAITIQSDASVGWVGSVTIAALRKGSGAVTFAAGGGVTLRGDLATPSQYGSKGIVRIGANEWAVIAP